MTRPVLSPHQAKGGDWPVGRFRTLPRNVQAFGYVPDIAKLMAGDVVLFSGAGFVPWAIRSAQLVAQFDPSHAVWTHAALYVGKGTLVEAVPVHGVRVAPLVEATFGRTLLVRRRRKTADGASELSMEQRYTVVIDALAQIKRGYSLGLVPALAWNALRQTLGRPVPGHVAGVVICSNIISRAYMTALQLALSAATTDVTWPADLSFCEELDDIPIGWVKVAA